MIEHDVAYGLEKAIELAPNDGCPITLTIGECDSFVSRLRQAEKDAARYRWLRDDYRHEYCVDDLFDGSSSSVDNRIDEAMQCSK